MLKLTNPRGEIATTDGDRVWSGTDTDEIDIAFNELQDIETVFPLCAVADGDSRVSVIARDCLLCRAPSISPADDAEKAKFRCAWNVCTFLKNEMEVKVYGHIFSSDLGVFSTDVFVGLKCGHATILTFSDADPSSVVRDRGATPFSAFTTPDEPIGCGRAYLAAMQMAILAAGSYLKSVPFGSPVVLFADDRMTRTVLDDRSASAALMIALRKRTPWFKEYMARLPF